MQHATSTLLLVLAPFLGSPAYALPVLRAVQGPLQPKFDDVAWALVPTAQGTRELLLDLYLPRVGQAPHPVVIYVHGGGWSSGTHDGARPYFQTLLDAGIAVASVSYRFSQEAPFPAQIHDVKGAVRWLHAKGLEYSVDGCRVGAFGTSAGAHLAALLGTTYGDAALEGTTGGNAGYEVPLRGVVSYFAPTHLFELWPDYTVQACLRHDEPGKPIGNLIGFAPGIGVIRQSPSAFPAEMALLAQASPALHAGAGDAPFFLAHSLDDCLVPYAQALRLRDALQAGGVLETFVSVSGDAHNGNGYGPGIDGQAVQFLAARLAAPCGG